MYCTDQLCLSFAEMCFYTIKLLFLAKYFALKIAFTNSLYSRTVGEHTLDIVNYSGSNCVQICTTRTWSSSRPEHDDVIKWKHFPRYWPFVRGIHRSPVNYQHKGQWRGALMFSLIWAWMNGWVNNREAGDLIRHRAHYDVTLMVGCPNLRDTVTALILMLAIEPLWPSDPYGVTGFYHH